MDEVDNRAVMWANLMDLQGSQLWRGLRKSLRWMIPTLTGIREGGYCYCSFWVTCSWTTTMESSLLACSSWRRISICLINRWLWWVVWCTLVYLSQACLSQWYSRDTELVTCLGCLWWLMLLLASSSLCLLISWSFTLWGSCWDSLKHSVWFMGLSGSTSSHLEGLILNGWHSFIALQSLVS